MAPGAGKSKEDPVEKIQRMISESIEAALAGRERKELEAKDPAARLEGIIDRIVGKHFEEFAKGLEEGMGESSSSGKGKAAKGDEGDGGGDIIRELFG